jgi:hypothetical protein
MSFCKLALNLGTAKAARLARAELLNPHAEQVLLASEEEAT